MDPILRLLEEYDLNTLLTTVVTVAFALKMAIEVKNWYYEHLKQHFMSNIQQEHEMGDISAEIYALKSRIESLERRQRQTAKYLNEKVTALGASIEDEISELRHGVEFCDERIQELIRNYIIYQHNLCYYERHYVEEMTWQHLEMLYSYYKKGGGNSVIDVLMGDLRKLPHHREGGA